MNPSFYIHAWWWVPLSSDYLPVSTGWCAILVIPPIYQEVYVRHLRKWNGSTGRGHSCQRHPKSEKVFTEVVHSYQLYVGIHKSTCFSYDIRKWERNRNGLASPFLQLRV